VSIARESSETAQAIGAAVGSHFFAGTTHGEALFRLEHLVETGCRCGMVTGPSGTGKSTVLAVFVEECRRAGLEAVAIDVTGLNSLELLERLARRLGVTSQAHGRAVALWTEVTDALVGRVLAGQGCVVVIDHLDRATNDCRQLVRRLATRGNAHQGETWIPSFSGRLFPAVPREWRERDDLRIELNPLNEVESRAYLQSLLEFLGRPTGTLAAAAATFFAAAQGIPAELERLAKLSLERADESPADVRDEAFESVIADLRGLRFSA
jgi:type II secretory pathway predicted ATPase ExeA